MKKHVFRRRRIRESGGRIRGRRLLICPVQCDETLSINAATPEDQLAGGDCFAVAAEIIGLASQFVS